MENKNTSFQGIADEQPMTIQETEFVTICKVMGEEPILDEEPNIMQEPTFPMLCRLIKRCIQFDDYDQELKISLSRMDVLWKFKSYRDEFLANDVLCFVDRWKRHFHDIADPELKTAYNEPEFIQSAFSYIVSCHELFFGNHYDFNFLKTLTSEMKIGYIQMTHNGSQKADFDFFAYIDTLTEWQTAIWNDELSDIERQNAQFMDWNPETEKGLETRFDTSPELLNIFNQDENHVQTFLKNIQGKQGADIARIVRHVVKMGWMAKSDQYTPIFNALKDLGYNVRTMQNWNNSFSTKKQLNDKDFKY